MDKVIESYTPSKYQPSLHSINFGDSVIVNGEMANAPRYDTVYQYRPSGYSPSSYKRESHSYSASSAEQQTTACYIKNSSGGYSLAAQAYRWWKSYTPSSHSYRASSYTEESYSPSQLITKKVNISYTPSEYTKSALKVRPVTLELGFFRTRNVTALTV